MGRDDLTILIIGDRFVTAQLFQAALEKTLAGSPRRVTYKVVETAWPDDPLKDVEEVHEGVGDVDAILDKLPNVDIIVTDYGAVTRRMIEHAPRLKLIAVARGGPVSINTKAASEKGIPVVNLPGRNSRAVAEFTFGLMFCQLKKITECHADMKRGVWRGDCYRFENAPREFPGLVAGLVGFGSVGQLLAPMLRCVGMRVLAYDPFVALSVLDEAQVAPVTLDALLNQSDLVSLHARLTSENAGMMGEAEFRAMKPSAHLINTARGGLVDHSALYRALKEGWIAGAALDIYDTEPIDIHHPLLELNNVTFTPHIAGSSRETAIRSADLLAQKVSDFLEHGSSYDPIRTS
jgi:D-3-phosphoglycerate dehydrogenase / 2-oxoglutarate reductase